MEVKVQVTDPLDVYGHYTTGDREGLGEGGLYKVSHMGMFQFIETSSIVLTGIIICTRN